MQEKVSVSTVGIISTYDAADKKVTFFGVTFYFRNSHNSRSCQTSCLGSPYTKKKLEFWLSVQCR